MTSQSVFSFPEPSSSSTQQATFTSFSPGQTYITSEHEEYETWAMKMEYWIINTDYNLWKIIQNGNSKKSLGRDLKRGIIILPPVFFEEYAKPDNDDVNMKFLRAFPLSWSQVALTLKTRGSLEYLSFDDLYNKLSTNTKTVYSDQPSHSSSITYTFAHSGSIMEDVLHSFVAKNEPTQQLSYEDFEQADQLEMEELDIKWQMAIDIC
nr:hypothetical protein [Tanacetum cinerariifolium]